MYVEVSGSTLNPGWLEGSLCDQQLRLHRAFEMSILTSLPRIDNEAAVVEGGSLDQAVTVSSDLAGVANLGLDDHDCDGTVGDMLSVL